MAKTSILDLNNVIKLAANPRARQLAPALTQLFSRGKFCSVCARRKTKILESVLKQLSGLPATQLEEIRTIVGSERVELHLPGQPKPIVIEGKKK